MTEAQRPFQILFACTGNSARSIFGEYLIKRFGRGLFDSYSARPVGRSNPYTLRDLEEVYHPDAGEARSKGFEEFSGCEFDFVITACDKAREACPVWPGQPMIAHWGVPDPASLTEDEDNYRRFKQGASLIERRIEMFCALPLEKLERFRVSALIWRIGNA